MTLDSIKKTLESQFSPDSLEVTDESHLHAGRSDRISHIKIIIVSSAFSGKSLLNRHRDVYNCLRNEMANGLHAVSIHAYTPVEWLDQNQTVADTPKCHGGSQRERAPTKE